MLDPDGPHVDREAHTVQFEPTVVASFEGVDEVAKIVGVSDDYATVAAAANAVRETFGDDVSASRSQPYYLDVTHPDANKGYVVRFLSERYGIPAAEIATIGDRPNDVLMFAPLGHVDRDGERRPPRCSARRTHVTATNDQDGFANAVERFILREGG